MRNLFPTLFLSLIFTSCGGSSSGGNKNENIYSTRYTNSPIFLEMQSAYCSSGIFPEKIEYDLFLHMEEKDSVGKFDFTALITNLFLKDLKTIAKSTSGEKSEVITDSRGARLITKVKPKDIKFCPEVEKYYQNSIESAALNTAFFIKKTRDNFLNAVPSIQIDPITLNISPSILMSSVTEEYGELKKESYYWTDNAFYSPDDKSITFLPHSQEMRYQGLDVNFWEVPMIAAHEYGHHIFQSIFDINETQLSLGCFDHMKEKKNYNKSKKLRIAKVSDVLVAFNEAFADLISYYTLSRTESSVKGIKCLEVSRDIDSAHLKNGKSKLIDREFIDSFFSYFEESTSCDEPSYQEVHILGAGLAYNMNKLMGHFTQDKNEKLNVIVGWVEQIRLQYPTLKKKTAETFFRENMASFLDVTLKRFNKTDDTQTCRLIRESFPGLRFKNCRT